MQYAKYAIIQISFKFKVDILSIDEEFYGAKASTIIKTAMAKHQVKAPELAKKLTKAGHTITATQINNKLCKGNYKASWFLLVLNTLGEQQN